MRRDFTAYAAFLALALTFLLFISYNNQSSATQPEAQEEVGEEQTSLPQVIRSLDINKEYAFAGEPVPIRNFDVAERLDRELSVNTYWHSSTLLNIKHAHRFFPVIEPILRTYGVPDDFKFLAVAESNLRNVTSPAGAKGIWQFVSNTGRHYGLEINHDVDERYHYEKATEAACKYLLDYYDDFGSWTLAAAAYNMGGPRLKKNLATQKAGSYYDLNLNQETSRYVFRELAIKEIMSNPKDYGFYVDKSHMYAPLQYRTVEVDTSVTNWGDFANQQGTSYRMLKVYNPWLITGELGNSKGKVYKIKLPEEG
jgi:membrane-bound lytic murein transglycosylase D